MATSKGLTKADAARLGENRKQWSQAFASALRNWCRDNGYTSFSKLKAELGIPDGSWKHLLDNRGGVVGDVTVYARLYVRTGLPEMDPRTIPPRVRYAARVGRYSEGKRVCTDQEYEKWRKGYQPPPTLVEGEPPPDEVIPFTAVVRQPKAEPQTVGALVDRFLANSEERIARRVVEMLRQDREESGDIGELADRLFRALEKYLDGTPEDRDRLMAKFGKTHLSRVFSVLRDLSSEDRETVLQLNRSYRRK